jgi:hypothetical protein
MTNVCRRWRALFLTTRVGASRALSVADRLRGAVGGRAPAEVGTALGTAEPTGAEAGSEGRATSTRRALAAARVSAVWRSALFMVNVLLVSRPVL